MLAVPSTPDQFLSHALFWITSLASHPANRHWSTLRIPPDIHSCFNACRTHWHLKGFRKFSFSQRVHKLDCCKAKTWSEIDVAVWGGICGSDATYCQLSCRGAMPFPGLEQCLDSRGGDSYQTRECKREPAVFNKRTLY